LKFFNTKSLNRARVFKFVKLVDGIRRAFRQRGGSGAQCFIEC